MQGIVLADKPAGWTSFDVVNYVRKLVATAEGKKPKNVKVGHSGTLDPFATGLLILLVGKDYTRQAGDFSKLDKTYEMTAVLGQTSTTGDPEGEIIVGSDRMPSEDEIKAIITELTGEIEQIPPAYSAIKVNGQRAYKLAREGKEVVLEPRHVTVHTFELLEYNYPELKLIADVSSGTYIRTLVEDLGKKLGTGAYTSALRRTKVGDYNVADAKAPTELSY
ncbi:MAG TPA: tRNA pseudouridine(55) synthase TruB [Candidatus Saccharimonadales bacterium]|nr:tRNA pseudouridine(55) synthase TruB [Candidatus Saccharimonadales bacterium]